MNLVLQACRAAVGSLLGVALCMPALAQLRAPIEPRTQIPQRYIAPGDLEIHLRPALPGLPGQQMDPIAYADTFFGEQRSQTMHALEQARLPCRTVSPNTPVGSLLRNPADCLPTRTVPQLPAYGPGVLSAMRVGIDTQNPYYQYALGRAYDTQGALPTEYAEAAKWYASAGRQGYADAQYRLATMYETGVGVRQDDPQAMAWYQAAAANGSAAAQRDYAAYLSGRDYSVAPGGGVLYAKRAALSGYGERVVMPPGSTVLVYDQFPEWVRVYAPITGRWGWMKREQVQFRW